MRPYFTSSLKERNQAIAESKREWLAWLEQGCDAGGECDSCHSDAPLWRLPYELDDEPDAEWMFCAKCFRKIITAHK